MFFITKSSIVFVKVHRIVKFKQSDWLKKCNDFNAGKRKNAVLKKTF